jgi:hypothetical protein
MKTIVNLLEKKLELLKNGGLKNEILETDILFAKEYDEMLIKFEVKNIDQIDKKINRENLIKLKKLVKAITEIENNNNLRKPNLDRKVNKKIADLYKKNMKK